MLRPLQAQFDASARNQRSNDMRRNRFPPPDRVNAFVGLGFQMNLFGADAQSLCQRLPHLGKMRPQLRLFSNHPRIDMLDHKMLLVQQLLRMFQEKHPVRPLPLWIGARKMRPDTANPRRTQQRIAQRMRQHIAIRMSYGSFVKRQSNPPDHELAPLRQPMQVIADSAARAHTFWRSRST